MVQDCEEVERGLPRLGRKSRRGCEGGMHNLSILLLHPDVTGVYIQQLGFF